MAPAVARGKGPFQDTPPRPSVTPPVLRLVSVVSSASGLALTILDGEGLASSLPTHCKWSPLPRIPGQLTGETTICLPRVSRCEGAPRPRSPLAAWMA